MRRHDSPAHARAGCAAVTTLIAVLAACEPNPPAPRAAMPATPLDSAPEIVARQSEPAAAAEDAALAGRVSDAIAGRPELRVKVSQVRVRDGVVTLQGVAQSPADSHQAALTALEVPGVRSVNNELALAGS